MLQYGAHALLELGVLRLACGAADGCWRGGEWTTDLPVVYKEALDHLGSSDLSDTV
jgi:hypothetical protein